MKKLLLLCITVMAAGCAKDGTVRLPDLGPEVKLLQANDELQDMRLDSLEIRVTDLESRMSDAEDAIDANEEKISELCDSVADLEEDLDALRSELRSEVRSLRRADRQQRRTLRRKVRKLRMKLLAEMRSRQSADQALQREIDSLERTVRRNTAIQSLINGFLAYGLYQTNQRIDQLQSRIARALSDLNSRVGVLESEVTDIQNNITRIASAIRGIYTRVGELESSMISVDEQCDGSYLLNTPDGTFGIGYETREVTENFSIGDTVQYFDCELTVRGRCFKGQNRSLTISDSGSVTFDVIDDVMLMEIPAPTCEGE